MSRNVHKYPVPLWDGAFMRRPKAWKPLHVGVDGAGELCLWAEVEIDGETCPQVLKWIGTGHEVLEGGSYIGTTIAGPFVWHLYELPWADAPRQVGGTQP